MAKKKTDEEAAGPKPGTVEYERQRIFEEQKADYEARTGETVNYVPPTPLTSTPLPEVAGETPAVQSDEPAKAEGEG